MIPLSKIDDKLSIYNENKVILFGAGNVGKQVYARLKSAGIRIFLFCDNSQEKWNTKMDGISIVPPERLAALSVPFLIQISSTYNDEIEDQLTKMGITNYISIHEFEQRMYDLSKYQVLNTTSQRYHYANHAHLFDVLKTNNEWPAFDYALRANFYHYSDYLILCLPPKTGDWTLNASFAQSGVEYVNFWHSFHHMNPLLKELLQGKRLKIITAVREPVSQNLSIFFNMCDSFWDVPEYWENGGDVQALFDSWIVQETKSEAQLHRNNLDKNAAKITFPYFDAFKKAENIDYVIQNFFENQFEPYSGIDIYQYPFDREKGYSVIHTETADLFIYQLEKLNEIKEMLENFVGIENTRWIHSNVGSEKWYSAAYQMAREKIEFSRDYIEECYNTRLVTHFYKPEDIERYRRQWESHIAE